MKLQNVLKVEWLKFQNRRTLIYVAVAAVINLAMVILAFSILDIPPDSDGSPTMTPELINSLNPYGAVMTQFSGALALIASLFFIHQYGEEIQCGMIRKNVIDGQSRADIFMGKMISLFGSLLLWTLLLLVLFLMVGVYRLKGQMGLILGSIQWEQGLKFYIHLLMYGSFSFFMLTLTRSANYTTIILLALSTIVEGLAVFAFMYFEIPDAAGYMPFTLASAIRAADILSTGQIAAFTAYVLVFLGAGQFILYRRDL